MNSIGKWRMISLKDLGDARGSLVVIEGEDTIPFSIQRVFFMYGSTEGAVRGRHANRKSSFVLVCLSGQCKVKLFDGKNWGTVLLDSPRKALYIPRMVWKEMFGFSHDAILLVLASSHYSPDEYIFSVEQFANAVEQTSDPYPETVR